MLDALFSGLVGLNVALLIFLLSWPRSNAFGGVVGTVADPFVVAVVLLGTFAIDFVVFYADPGRWFFERPLLLGRSDVFLSFLGFTALNASAVAGLIVGATAVRGAPPSLHALPHSHRRLAVSRWIMACTLVGAVVLIRELVVALPQIMSGGINKQLFFQGNRLLLGVVGISIPVLAVYLVNRPLVTVRSMCAVVLTVTLVVLAGSRSLVLLVGLIVATVAIARGRPIKGWWYLAVVIPMGYGLALLRYVFRESWRYSDFASFVEARGGFFALFLHSPEIGLAEGFTAATVVRPEIHSTPFDGFLGALVYPIPRDLLTVKPTSASAILTEHLSPRHWDLTRSELLVSGFGDLVLQFGPFVAPLMAFAGGLALAVTSSTLIGRRDEIGVAALPVVLWMFISFMRTSAFQVGGYMWPAAVVLLGYWVFTRLSWAPPRLLRTAARLVWSGRGRQ